ncbi:MAG: gliding motility lipoprotein GldD [Bacteroidota bacterium]
MKKHVRLFFYCTALALTSACSDSPTPKPKGYFRITLPEKKEYRYDGKPCPFSFSIPSYSTVAAYRDSLAQPCWKHLRFPQFNSEVFLSYKPINGDLQKLMEDSRTLVYKHTLKAESIEETVFHRPGENFGILYDISGNAASPLQFFITDSTQHFLRGALYFNTAPQPDSLAPVIDFLRKDVIKMMETLEWEKP